MIDERCLQPLCSSGNSVSVWIQMRTSAAGTGQSFRHEQVYPYAGITDPPADLSRRRARLEPCSIQDVTKERWARQRLRIQREIAVNSVRSNVKIAVANMKIDMSCAPTRITASRCSESASRASSNTRRATTYSGSGSPDIIMYCHPVQKGFRLVS